MKDFTQLYSAQALLRTAEDMIIAAKTAPKARGVDNMIYAIIQEEQIQEISETMYKIGEKYNASYFIRDAKNIMSAPLIVVLGTYIKSIGLMDVCGLCGCPNCTEKDKQPNIPCVYNSGDLGIAIGSAVSVAMDRRVDNRVMFSIGQALKQLKFFGDEPQIIYGIPLSASAKNIFFDRKA